VSLLPLLLSEEIALPIASLPDMIFYLGDKNGEAGTKIGALIPYKKMIKNGKKKYIGNFSLKLQSN